MTAWKMTDISTVIAAFGMETGCFQMRTCGKQQCKSVATRRRSYKTLLQQTQYFSMSMKENESSSELEWEDDVVVPKTTVFFDDEAEEERRESQGKETTFSMVSPDEKPHASKETISLSQNDECKRKLQFSDNNESDDSTTFHTKTPGKRNKTSSTNKVSDNNNNENKLQLSADDVSSSVTTATNTKDGNTEDTSNMKTRTNASHNTNEDGSSDGADMYDLLQPKPKKSSRKETPRTGRAGLAGDEAGIIYEVLAGHLLLITAVTKNDYAFFMHAVTGANQGYAVFNAYHSRPVVFSKTANSDTMLMDGKGRYHVQGLLSVLTKRVADDAKAIRMFVGEVCKWCNEWHWPQVRNGGPIRLDYGPGYQTYVLLPDSDVTRDPKRKAGDIIRTLSLVSYLEGYNRDVFCPRFWLAQHRLAKEYFNPPYPYVAHSRLGYPYVQKHQQKQNNQLDGVKEGDDTDNNHKQVKES